MDNYSYNFDFKLSEELMRAFKSDLIYKCVEKDQNTCTVTWKLTQREKNNGDADSREYSKEDVRYALENNFWVIVSGAIDNG